MAKKLKNREVYFELAQAFTHSLAHRDKSNVNHLFVVNIAYIFWRLFEGKRIDTLDLNSVISDIKVLS